MHHCITQENVQRVEMAAPQTNPVLLLVMHAGFYLFLFNSDCTYYSDLTVLAFYMSLIQHLVLVHSFVWVSSVPRVLIFSITSLVQITVHCCLSLLTTYNYNSSNIFLSWIWYCICFAFAKLPVIQNSFYPAVDYFVTTGIDGEKNNLHNI